MSLQLRLFFIKIPRDIKRKSRGTFVQRYQNRTYRQVVILLLLTEDWFSTSYMNGKEIFLMSMMINLFSV